ncbi:MAG: glycosyltransferase [Candidatus Cloacimonetes bacterium]|nr:glycosyltransferase [Candidatus Cloacimonadota bacterium]
MKILFLTSRFPFPPNRGDKVRTYQFLKLMSEFHDIHLFSFIESEEELKFKKQLYDYCSDIVLIKKSKPQHIQRFVMGLLNRLPFQVAYYFFPHIKKKISNYVKVNKIDIIYAHLIRMAPYVQEINVKKILDYTDAISMEYKRSLPFRKKLFEKIFFNIEAKRTRKYEKKIIKYFDEGWFISPEDIMDLGFEKDPKIKILPNSVETSKMKQDYSQKGIITFVGNMSVEHNISAVDFVTNEIMPTLLNDEDVKFNIIGANLSKRVLKMEGINNTNVVGFVDDLYTELVNSDIFIAPIFFSSGIQNKVLEAMAAGLPVITTKNVALSIQATQDTNLIIAATKDEFVKKIKLLYKDKSLREKIGRNGRALIEKKYSKNSIRKILKELKG